MLQPIREQAGLGYPLEPFTTNASETVNSVLKSHVNFKSSQLLEFVEELKEVVDAGAGDRKGSHWSWKGPVHDAVQPLHGHRAEVVEDD